MLPMPENFDKYLSPLFSRLDDILDFSNVTYKNKLEEEEYPHLRQTVKTIGSKIKKTNTFREKLKPQIEDALFAVSQETGDDRVDAFKVYNALLKKMYAYIDQINADLNVLHSPYFGKIVFRNDKTKRASDIYIGKFGLFDEETNKPLISDWRAPIANLYYENSGPRDNVEFEAPAGKITGDLLQKRQFEISDGRFKQIYDIRTGNASADEFLLSELSSRSGKKLVDIVSTIQNTQNKIIRAPINSPIILQGVAGSGKTTILLHRLAYIAYTFKDKISMDKSLLLAPNKMFIDYISELLPNLGVFDVATNTYISLSKAILKWDDTYIFADVADDNEIKRIKGSLQFYKGLNLAFSNFLDSLFAEIPDPTSLVIESRFRELSTNPHASAILERLELAVQYAFAQLQYKGGIAGDFMGRLAHLQKREKKILKFLHKQFDIRRLYLSLLKDSESFEQAGISKEALAQVEAYTRQYFNVVGKLKYYKSEDLPLLLSIKLQLTDPKEFQKDLIMIDEAQDYSIAQLLTMAKLAKNGNLMLAGDVAQAIVPPFYITDWQEVVDAIKEETGFESQFFQLNKCYRTTIEIIDYTNEFLKDYLPSGFKLPEAVLRHGDPVTHIRLESDFADAKDISTIVDAINKQFENGASTVGIVAKDSNHAQRIADRLSREQDLLTRNVVTQTSQEHQEGILVLPVASAKGLEFDSVFVADLNPDRYGDNEYDRRLLYVAMTRALHKLFVITNKSA